MNNLCKLYFKSQYKLNNFTGKKIIINTKTADEYNLNAGDKIYLKINGVKYRMTISAIANPEGVFIEDGESKNALVPYDFLNTIYRANGKYSIIFIKLEIKISSTHK